LRFGIEIGVKFVLDLFPDPVDERKRRFTGIVLSSSSSTLA
jgi:hypothetical protein